MFLSNLTYNNQIALNDKYKTLNCDCSDWGITAKTQKSCEVSTIILVVNYAHSHGQYKLRKVVQYQQ